MDKQLLRWRLVLGEAAELGLGSPTLGETLVHTDAALSWLYDREEDLAERDVRGATGAERQGGSGGSVLSVPEWIGEVHRLFPKEAIERLERDAVERYEILEVVTNPDVLSRVEPNPVLLRAVLQTKHLMNEDVLRLARELVDRVVRDLMEKLAREIERAFGGSLDRRRSSPMKIARNFDFRRTIRENLPHYSKKEERLYIRRPYFHARVRPSGTKWQVILLVDQSGSMADSVIHSSITAACLLGIRSLRTHLCTFDTEVVDLTEDVGDPVETLMKVQLGGGTDIQKAVAYAESLIDAPRRTIVVLITDFVEGGPPGMLERRVRTLVEGGVQVLGLAALDSRAEPVYDEGLARRLVELGAEVGAMTPGELASWIAEKVRS